MMHELIVSKLQPYRTLLLSNGAESLAKKHIQESNQHQQTTDKHEPRKLKLSLTKKLPSKFPVTPNKVESVDIGSPQEAGTESKLVLAKKMLVGAQVRGNSEQDECPQTTGTPNPLKLCKIKLPLVPKVSNTRKHIKKNPTTLVTKRLTSAQFVRKYLFTKQT